MSNKVEITLLESINANDSAAVLSINNNFLALRDALNNTLSRDGTSPNYMDDVLDMNSYRIINTAEPSYDSDYVTLGWIKSNYGDIATYAERAEAAANSAEAAYSNIRELATIVSNDAQGIIDVINDFENKWAWSKFENVEWSGQFVSNPDSTVYVYKSTMQFPTVSDIANRVPFVMFSSSDIENTDIASYTDTSPNGLTIYTKEPIADLVIPTIVFQ